MPLFPNRSIAGIALAMILLFLLAFSFKSRSSVRWLLLPPLVLLFMMLICSGSRSGWLGLAAGIGYMGWRYDASWRRLRRTRGALIIMMGLAAGLLWVKKGSTAGRMHIYALSARICADHWPQGAGAGRFSALFNEYQADYFSHHSLVSRRALLADDTFYAFNDYLQWTAETGLAGVVVLLLGGGLLIQHIRDLYRAGAAHRLATGCTAALVSLSVSALFSYPAQVRSIQGLALIFILLLAAVRTGKVRPSVRSICFRVLALVLFAGWGRMAGDDLRRNRMERTAFELAREGFKQQSLRAYAVLTADYPCCGYNWYAYARQLYYAGRLNEARNCLHQCLRYYSSRPVYALLADIATECGDDSMAIAYRLRALYMVPNRMQSRADLAQLYLHTGDTARARNWYRTILSMPVKVPSERTEQLQKEAYRKLAE